MLKKAAILMTLFAMTFSTVSVRANTAALEQTILNGVRAHQDVIDISSLNVDPQSAVDAYILLKNTEPDLFCVDESVSCSYLGNTAETLVLDYVVPKNEIDQQKKVIDTQIDKIVNIAKEGKTDAEKAKLVYDYFQANTQYDYTMANDSVYDLLSSGKGICISYAQAYKLAMEELNIPCEVSISYSMAHAWNIVKIDGSWYNVDVTYDITGNGGGRNFLKSDSVFKTTGHSNWTNKSSVSCLDTKYDSQL